MGEVSLRRACALLVIAAPALGAAAERIGVEEAVAAALVRNATLLELQADVAAERARVGGASLPLSSNPELELYAGPRWRDRATSTDYGVGLAQRLELFGQRGLRMEAAGAALAAAEARLDMARVETAAEVRVRSSRRSPRTSEAA